MASHPNSEKAGRDPDGITSILAVDQDTDTKTIKLMTVTEGGITKLHVKADTELTLTGVKVDNVSLSAGSNVIGAVTQSGTWDITTLTGITNNINNGDI